MKNELTSVQVGTLRHLCKKGYGAYRIENETLKELVDKGLVYQDGYIGPFGELCYRPTMKGRELLKE
ncbi:MAG: hypothetical protein ACRCUJ_07995 [Phocaeicola sp.]